MDKIVVPWGVCLGNLLLELGEGAIDQLLDLLIVVFDKLSHLVFADNALWIAVIILWLGHLMACVFLSTH